MAPVKIPSLIGRDQEMDDSFPYVELYTNYSTYGNESSICWSRPIRDKPLIGPATQKY